MTQVCSFCECEMHSLSPLDMSYWCPLNFSSENYTHVVVFDSTCVTAFNDMVLKEQAVMYGNRGGLFKTGQFDFFDYMRLFVAQGKINHNKIIFYGFDDNRYLTLNKYGNPSTMVEQDLYFSKQINRDIIQDLLMRQSFIKRQERQQ